MFTSDATLLAFTAKALRIYLACLFMFGIQIACQMTFTSIGRAKASIIVAVMRKFILLIPLIYIMPAILHSNQTMAVYMAEPIADFLAVTFTAVLLDVYKRQAPCRCSRLISENIRNNMRYAPLRSGLCCHIPQPFSEK